MTSCLAFSIFSEDISTIKKSSSAEHTVRNLHVLDFALEADEKDRPEVGPFGSAWRSPGSESVQKVALVSRRSNLSARAKRLIVRAVRLLIS